ncbi:hypothetical protein [Neolewinella agarilytica]|uniref:Uncharacterized protein n=1 Tax=Neolewinella agarilytica TaxID=478744 RepID=A0A1H9MW78_9BACT|nr:hypothetical protein [Neolewinella agarilytica]SER27928.1 hypothetical protein SAMN05444359_1326 [Neolewinella agarilytica]
MRLFPILFLLFFFSCHSGPELNGHWHLIHNRDHSIESTIDFLDDTSFLYQSHPLYYGGWGGYIDREAQTMHWGGECMMGNWRYQLEADNRWEVYSLKDNDKLVGTMLPHPDCSGVDDLFLDSKMAIQLPILTDTLSDLGSPALVSFLYVGPVKEEYHAIYPNEWYISLGDKIIDSDLSNNFLLFDEQHRVKLPERLQEKIKKLVFLDKNTPLTALEPIIRHYCQKGYGELYLAGITASGKEARLVYRRESLTALEERLE